MRMRFAVTTNRRRIFVIISPETIKRLAGQIRGDQIFFRKNFAGNLSPVISGPLLPEVPAKFR
jgi:hypothetical protein